MAFGICVIGCGSMSSHVHAPSIALYARQHSGTKLLACCDLDESRAIEYQNRYGFARHYTSYETMLNSEHPDAVCLIVQEHRTCELACRILQMGYPVLMEKPPGTTVEQIDRMIAASEATGALAMVAFNRRYTPLTAKLQQELAGFGPEAIQHVRYEFTRVGRVDSDFSLTAIHGIDAARFLVGSDYEKVAFVYREFPDLGPTTANILMTCRFESGATGYVEFMPVSGVSVERAAVHVHDHSFHLSLPTPGLTDGWGLLRHFHKDVIVEEINGRDLSNSEDAFILNGFYDENAAFFDSVRLGVRPASDLADARQSVEIMECVRNRKDRYER